MSHGVQTSGYLSGLFMQNMRFTEEEKKIEDLTARVKAQINEIDGLLQKVKAEPKLRKDLVGATIRTSNKKNGFQYYLSYPGQKRKYIKRSEMTIVPMVLQNEYNMTLEKKLLKAKKKLEQFLREYKGPEFDALYDSICESKKCFVRPLVESDEMVVAKWLEATRGNQNTFPEEGKYLTENGERVRSKSEKILADMFKKYRVPYRYEPRVEIRPGKVIYPDFVLLNIRERKTYYWEHLGLISDGEYASKNLEKINQYEERGIILGDNLLISMESEESPLNVKLIEKKIQRYLI